MSRDETSVEARRIGEETDGRPYGRQIVEFLRYKRALGFKYAKEETCLWQFSRMCTPHVQIVSHKVVGAAVVQAGKGVVHVAIAQTFLRPAVLVKNGVVRLAYKA